MLTTGINYWIGLSDAAWEGHYVWAESLQPAGYINWGPGEPNDDADRNDCLFKSVALSLPGWFDLPCEQIGVTDWGETHALCEA